MKTSRLKLKYLYYSYYVLCILVLLSRFTQTFTFLEYIFKFILPYLPILGILLILTKTNFTFDPIFLILIPLQFLGQSNFVITDNFIYIVIFYLLFKDESPDEFIKLHFYSLSFYVLILSISSLLGILDNVSFYTGVRFRRGLTFSHPNMLAIVLLSIHSSWFYLITQKIFKHSSILIISLILQIFLCFFYYDTRNGAISLLLLLLFIIIINPLQSISKSDNYKKIINHAWILPIIFFLISVFITITFDNSNYIYNKINSILSGRLGLQSNAFSKYGYPLFGKGMTFSTGKDYDYVDAFYNAKVYEYGLLVESIFLIYLSFSLKKFFKTNDVAISTILLLIFITYFLESFIEKETFSFIMCPFLVYLFISNNQKRSNHDA